jgi:hypothetical protein
MGGDLNGQKNRQLRSQSLDWNTFSITVATKAKIIEDSPMSHLMWGTSLLDQNPIFTGQISQKSGVHKLKK